MANDIGMKYLIYITLIILTNALFGQTEINFYPEMFDNLNASNMSTNILADRAGAPELIEQFNGEDNCDTSRLMTWFTSYNTLYYGDVNTPSILSPESLLSQIESEFDEIIPIKTVFYSYDRITENALSNGYLQLIDTLFYDGQNASEAYDSYNCLAMSPLFMDDLTTNITFKAKDIVGNTANQIVAAEIDFADGSGYLPYIADSIYSLSYSSSGGYVINLRIITTSADTMVARSAISVLKEEELSAKKGLLTGRGFSSDYDCEDCNEIPLRDEEY